jgi:hypothetical protein
MELYLYSHIRLHGVDIDNVDYRTLCLNIKIPSPTTACVLFYMCNTHGYKVPGITLSRSLKCWIRLDNRNHVCASIDLLATGAAVGILQKGRSIRLLFIMQVGSRLSADFKSLPPSLTLLYPNPRKVSRGFTQGVTKEVYWVIKKNVLWILVNIYNLVYWKHCWFCRLRDLPLRHA